MGGVYGGVHFFVVNSSSIFLFRRGDGNGDGDGGCFFVVKVCFKTKCRRFKFIVPVFGFARRRKGTHDCLALQLSNMEDVSFSQIFCASSSFSTEPC